MTEAELDELIDYCALLPSGADGDTRTFSAQWVIPLRSVSRMRLDFDLDLFTVAIVLGSLKRIDVLERQVQALQSQASPQGRAITKN